MDVSSCDISTLRTVHGRPVQTIAINGHFDSENAQEVAGRVEAIVGAIPDAGILILDGGNLTFMNSKAVGHLVMWHLALQEKGAEIRLARFPENVREVLSTTGVSQIIEHYPTEEEALP